MALKTLALSTGTAIRISKSGKIMVVDGLVNIRTNLTDLPSFVASVTYDDAQIEEYNGGKYANGEIKLGTNSLYKEKLAAIKEAGLSLAV